MKRLLLCWPIVLLCLSSCSTSLKNQPGDFPRHTSIIPKGSLKIFPDYAVRYVDLVQIGLVVGAVYYVSDPTAPTWEIVETRLPDNRVLYRLNKQYISMGGDGEGRYILSQRIEALVREQGLAGFRIERYEESVDNRILLPRRTAYAEIQLLASN